MIKTEQLGKQYNGHWLFRDLTCTFEPGKPAAVLGPNGSGKSTLLKIIMGLADPTEGKIIITKDQLSVSRDHFRKYYSFAAPYSGLFDELTVKENIIMYARFKPLKENLTPDKVLQASLLESHARSRFHLLSSGMKQRLRLALALFSDTECIFLDEPVSHLDKESVQWFHNLFRENTGGKTVLIATNQHPDEVLLCSEQTDISQYKKESPV